MEPSIENRSPKDVVKKFCLGCRQYHLEVNATGFCAICADSYTNPMFVAPPVNANGGPHMVRRFSRLVATKA
jgi:hypothetical protein